MTKICTLILLISLTLSAPISVLDSRMHRKTEEKVKKLKMTKSIYYKTSSLNTTGLQERVTERLLQGDCS